MIHVGNNIKQLMRQQNMDAPALAKLLGKSKQAVYMMLEKKDLNTALLRKLAEIFSVPVNIFLTDESSKAFQVEVLKAELERLEADAESLRKRMEAAGEMLDAVSKVSPDDG